MYAVGALLLYNFWIWVIRHITTHHRDRWLSLHIFVVGLCSTVIIWLFPFLVQKILGLTLITSISIPLIVGYVLYLLICALLLYAGYMLRFFQIHHWLKVVISFVIFLIIAIGGTVLGIEKAVIYFTLVAFGEEFIKFIFGVSLFEKMQIHYTDLLLFCLLSGFAFAFLENGFYVRYALEPQLTRLTPLQMFTVAMKTVTTRGLVNVAVHGFFTALIGLLSMGPSFDKQPLWKVGLGMLLGMGTHAIYNTFVAKGVGLMIPIAAVISYVLISYIMFKADTIFNQPKDGGIANDPRYG
ncbi:MAG: PrsW family intramembrane metalloprotease [Candidatus Absconditabacterales bacterium]|nr:PrsW family intramembrane metalloprotease [Candidatus Absconditabacterales bacterium]